VREAAEHARQQETLRFAAEKDAEESRLEVEMLKKQLAAMDDKGILMWDSVCLARTNACRARDACTCCMIYTEIFDHAVKATQRLDQRMKENAVAAMIDFIIDQALTACVPPDSNPQFDAFHGASPPVAHGHASVHPAHDARGASVAWEQQSTHDVAPDSSGAWEEGEGDGDAELRAWEAKRHRSNATVGCVCLRTIAAFLCVCVCVVYYIAGHTLQYRDIY
jgi:hypothetical protein